MKPARTSWSARADAVRHAPLLPLAVQFGYRRDPHNRARWKLPGSVLSIQGARFFDHARGRGGGGAIDLVMHVRGCRFREAVEFLEQTTVGPHPASAPPAKPAKLRLPPPHERLWPPVRDFLRTQRGLAADLLQLCHRDGLLYADERQNAVFLCRDARGQPVGAELVGTRPAPDGRTFKGLAPGSRKARGGFWLPAPDLPLDALLLVESALDALSAVRLLAGSLPPDTLVASSAGVAASLPPWLQAFQPPLILCAYDADPPGDQAAAALQRQLPNCQRLRPRGAKDWNELLQRTPTAA